MDKEDLKKNPTKEEYAAMIARAIANQKPIMSDEDREERLNNISPRIKESFSGMVPPPYDPGYGLSEVEKALRARPISIKPSPTDFDEELVNRILAKKEESDIQEETEQKQDRFNKIKALFGL